MKHLPAFNSVLAPLLTVLASACSSGANGLHDEGPSVASVPATGAGKNGSDRTSVSPDENSPPDEEGEAAAVDPWSAAFEPPLELNTERVRLEPLAPHHAELDFEAVTTNRRHLQRTLHWGDWPREDLTLEENRSSLEGHRNEFDRREAYAYTVLDPDGERCLGCVYLNPFPAGAGLPEDLRAGMVAFWVIEEQLATDLDQHLVDSLLEWFDRTWPLDLVAFLPHEDDPRSVALLESAGLAELASPQPGTRMFVWKAP